MFNLLSSDVIFLHAPSVYDFRKDTILFGPVSDVIPSSSVFEMYPMGITSIANHLENNGFNVQVINVAYRMLRDPKYDPEKQIKSANPKLWAIDLHWLPHTHGALALATLIKKYHPNAYVLMGGLSASYFHSELIKNPCVDFVMRGDSTEEPVLQLLNNLENNFALENVPNLTWKDHLQNIKINNLTHVPDIMDNSQIPAYKYMMRSVFKYWNLHNTVPYLRWMEYPMTALLIAKGCTQNCSICGGSKKAYRFICNRQHPSIRSPEKLIEDVRFIKRFSKAPIFIIHDIRLPGNDYAHRLLHLLKKEELLNEVVLELFAPADNNFFVELHNALPHYSLEMTLESHDPLLRKLNGKFAFSNEEIEETIGAALANGCNRLDIFFMVGIPKQTRESVLQSVEYSRMLLQRFGQDGKLKIYVAPLAPFLDPGSPAFEDPDKYGYKIRARTLEEHRERLTKLTWGQILNYESYTMPPDTLVETTYEATAKVIEMQAEMGLMDKKAAAKTLILIKRARRIVKEIEDADKLPEPNRSKRLASLKQEALQVNHSRIYAQTDFVSWGKKRLQLKVLGLAFLMVELFFEELKLLGRRLKRKWEKGFNKRNCQ